jgi:hypothetical protein
LNLASFYPALLGLLTIVITVSGVTLLIRPRA